MLRARMMRKVGQEVLFNKKHRIGQWLIEQGIKSGIFENIMRTASGILYTISFGPNGNKRHIDVERAAFMWKKRNGPPPKQEPYDPNRWR